MKALLDANVLVSAYGWPGRCRHLLESCFGIHPLVYSRELLEETAKNLRDKAHLPESLIEKDIEEIRDNGLSYEPSSVDSNACRDPHDLHVLGLAVAANADYIVSGDKDLLILKEFRGVRILSPTDFLNVLQQNG